MATKKAKRSQSRKRPPLVQQMAKKLAASRNRIPRVEEVLERGNDLQVQTLEQLGEWKVLAEKYLEPGVDALIRVAASVPELALRLNLIEKALWPRALLILRDNMGARCHRVNMPATGKGLSQAFCFSARHVGRQVIELEQLGAIPLVMLTVSVGGELQSEGEQVQAWIKVPHVGVEITAVVAVLG